ncbi:ubiquitin-like protein-NEDD8-like protein RUB3 [Actinidia eriantha]|uniref:ubiquitin-like protein-NEDD8-like protein RUB3 n=1 Tax=Actinidia eriantha TaxID=165200 RepID=UPI002590FF53|nr:ubiquitin-like protein-NEDD8-like protein RUB3 [Actinidia eriantha]
MDLYFKPTMGEPFEMEVGYFDTVLEIKEKVEKAKGIPVSKQTLIFNGQPLPDDLNVQDSTILHRSILQLLLPCNEPQSHHGSAEFKLVLKTPSSNVDIGIDSNDTIRRIKERMHEIEDIPVHRLVIRLNNHELMDEKFVRDYEIRAGSEIEIEVIDSPPMSSPVSPPMSSPVSIGSDRGRKIIVAVVTMRGTKKILVEVKGWDNVGVLRKELERLAPRLGIQLPAEGYFFIHKQNVMVEERTFFWHMVENGDTIEIFPGRVSGGS